MSNYLDLLAKLVLEFSHESIIIPLLIIGYIWINRDVFFHGICLVLISMIFNASLKATFQIPLNPSLGKEGYAFPSGHMQTSVVLYGFLYTFAQNRALKICLIALLITIGWGLIYFGYHNLVDIVGAIIFALLLIYLYKHIILNKSYLKSRYLFLAVIIFVSICLGYIKLIHIIPPHLWMAYYALFGLLIAQGYFNYRGLISAQTRRDKIVASIFCFACLFLVNAVFSVKSELILLMSPLRWFFIGVSIPFSVFVSSLIYNRGCNVKN